MIELTVLSSKDGRFFIHFFRAEQSPPTTSNVSLRRPNNPGTDLEVGLA
jgi:hypothetical protein